MYLNKKEQELFAYFLHLNFEDCEIPETTGVMEKALIRLQEKNVFGNVKFFHEEIELGVHEYLDECSEILSKLEEIKKKVIVLACDKTDELL